MTSSFGSLTEYEISNEYCENIINSRGERGDRWRWRDMFGCQSAPSSPSSLCPLVCSHSILLSTRLFPDISSVIVVIVLRDKDVMLL